MRFLTVLFVVTTLLLFANASSTAKAVTHYVVTNDDQAGPNTATFYVAGGTGSGSKLTLYKTVKTGGSGRGGESFAATRVTVVHDSQDTCVYVSDSGTNDIAGIVVKTQKIAGNFKGSSGDSGDLNGIGVAMNEKYLYAAFTASNTIATFKVLPGCKLKFLKDVSARGLGGGSVDGMSLHGNIMVVANADGSIESFNISKGAPVSNGDQQYSTAYEKDGGVPAGVDISKDGHYAIFGDAGYYVEAEVSDISSGKLAATVEYGGSNGGLGQGQNSNNVWLSPDDSLLYISANFSGEVLAAFFDSTTGTLKEGCNSGALKGFGPDWAYTLGLATENATGTGSVLWVAEWPTIGNPASIGIIEVSSKKGSCTLTESAKSPAKDPNSPALSSIGAYPPRPF